MPNPRSGSPSYWVHTVTNVTGAWVEFVVLDPDSGEKFEKQDTIKNFKIYSTFISSNDG